MPAFFPWAITNVSLLKLYRIYNYSQLLHFLRFLPCRQTCCGCLLYKTKKKEKRFPFDNIALLWLQVPGSTYFSGKTSTWQYLKGTLSLFSEYNHYFRTLFTSAGSLLTQLLPYFVSSVNNKKKSNKKKNLILHLMFLLLCKFVNAFRILLSPGFLEYSFILVKELLMILKIEDNNFGYVYYIVKSPTQTERYIILKLYKKQ